MVTVAGFDWIGIDLQHGLAGLADLLQLLAIVEKCGARKIARALSAKPNEIERVLDLGAHG